MKNIQEYDEEIARLLLTLFQAPEICAKAKLTVFHEIGKLVKHLETIVNNSAIDNSEQIG